MNRLSLMTAPYKDVNVSAFEDCCLEKLGQTVILLFCKSILLSMLLFIFYLYPFSLNGRLQKNRAQLFQFMKDSQL